MNTDLATLYKFGTLDPEDHCFEYSNEWAIEKTTDGSSRLVIAPTRHQIDLLIRLLKVISEPLWLLYVLVVPRGDNKEGRYQSPEPLSQETVQTFLKQFEQFLETDGRHNLRLAAESGSSQLIYDRHNVIYAYGPIDIWQMVLRDGGFCEAPLIRFPDPHSHHYHQSLDSAEDRITAHLKWHHTPLKQSDV